MPTRLVDVGTAKFVKPQLIEPTTLGPEAKYLTLSHCWGDHLPIKLLESNYLAMMHAISFESLPQTFQDALVLTKTFGMRYMWIDALCILQDSREDWQRESAQMCRIYENSYCNIAATASRNSSEGLFRGRDARLIQPLSIKLEGEKQDLCQVHFWDRKVEDTPLNRRAWVLQERVLSPRNLHFSTQVLWECNEIACSETFPKRVLLPDRLTNYDPSSRVFLKEAATRATQKIHDLPQDQQMENFNRLAWEKMVKHYSIAALTFETDKLVAIGGLAERFKSHRNDTYYAVLWGNSLVRGLLWSAYDCSKPKQYVAPSWSWASVSGLVVYNFPRDWEHKELVKIKGIDMEYRTSNPFGQVKSGTIHLTGKLLQLMDDNSKTSPQAVFADCLVGVGPFSTMYMDFKTDGENNKTEYFGLPLLRIFLGSFEAIHGLLLQPFGKVGQFRRIGKFQAFRDLKLIEAGMQCFDAKARDSGLEYCEDEMGGYKYSISII